MLQHCWFDSFHAAARQDARELGSYSCSQVAGAVVRSYEGDVARNDWRGTIPKWFRKEERIFLKDGTLQPCQGSPSNVALILQSSSLRLLLPPVLAIVHCNLHTPRVGWDIRTHVGSGVSSCSISLPLHLNCAFTEPPAFVITRIF